MTSPTPIRHLSLVEASRNAEEAIAQVAAAMHADWRAEAKWAVKQIAKTWSEFITDAVWDLLNEAAPDTKTHENRALGPIMRWAIAQGYVERTGKTRMGRRNAANKTPMPVYRSLICESCDDL